MNRLSLVAGAAAAFLVTAGWSVLQSAPVAPAAADQKLGMALMSAVVDYQGNLVRGSGATSVIYNGAGTGTYYVTFERSVRDCAVTGQVGRTGDGAGYYFGHLSANHWDAGGPNVLYVVTRAQTGTIGDSDFHLMVFCHK